MTRPPHREGSNAERRRDPRTESQLPVTLGLEGIAIEGNTCNISSSGTYCEIGYDIPLMTKLALTLMIPTPQPSAFHQVMCQGVVVRSESAQPSSHGDARFRIAIFFTDLKARDRTQLIAFVQRQLSDQSP